MRSDVDVASASVSQLAELLDHYFNFFGVVVKGISYENKKTINVLDYEKVRKQRKEQRAMEEIVGEILDEMHLYL